MGGCVGALGGALRTEKSPVVRVIPPYGPPAVRGAVTLPEGRFLDSRFRGNDERQGAIHRAPTGGDASP